MPHILSIRAFYSRKLWVGHEVVPKVWLTYTIAISLFVLVRGKSVSFAVIVWRRQCEAYGRHTAAGPKRHKLDL
jgi:hypothetical protein